MSKKSLQKYLIQQVSSLQDGYDELTLAMVPKEQAERLDFLVKKIKAIQDDFERVLKNALEQGRDITPDAYVWVNRKTSGFKNEYDSILENLDKGKVRVYWARKGGYRKGEILDKPPPGSMLMK